MISKAHMNKEIENFKNAIQGLKSAIDSKIANVGESLAIAEEAKKELSSLMEYIKETPNRKQVKLTNNF